MRVTPEGIEKGKTALAAIRWILTDSKEEHCRDHGPVKPKILWDLEGHIGAHCPACHGRLKVYPQTPMFVFIANTHRNHPFPKKKQMDLFGGAEVRDD